MGNVSTWAKTAAGNNTGSPPNFPIEGMLPSAVNDCMRENMAALACWYGDNQGSLTSTGTSNSYAITTNSGYSALADQPPILFIANHTNTGPATLNVDGLGSKAIHSNGAALGAGQIIEDVAFAVVYNATEDAYDILGGPNNNAANLTEGTLPDARLSSNVPLKEEANTFEATISIEGGGLDLENNRFIVQDDSGGTSRLVFGVDSGDDFVLGNAAIDTEVRGDTITLNGVDITDYARINDDNQWASTQDFANNVFLQWADTGGTDRLVFGANSSDDLLVGSAAFDLELRGNNTVNITDGELQADGNTVVDVGGGFTIGGTNNFSGTLQYGGDEVGYRQAPSRSISSSTNTTSSDSGKQVRMTGGSGQTFTLDSDPADDALIILLNTSGNDWTIAASGTLTWAAAGSTGNRTLADDGMATVLHIGSGDWYISGAGVN